MAKSQRVKGAAFEREIARLFAEDMPGADVRRGLGQTRSGSDCADVETPRFWVECKRRKRGNVRAALAQASEAAVGGRAPLAILKDDRKPAIASMYLDDWHDFVVEICQVGVVPRVSRTVKRGKLPRVRDALDRAISDRRPGTIACAEIWDENRPPFIVFLLDDFREFVREWWRNAYR